jgi:hypothetical protein
MARKSLSVDKDNIADFYNIVQPEKRAMIAALSQSGNITTAAGVAKTSRQNHYNWLAIDPAYGDAVKAAMQAAGDRLEEEARRRATEGTLEPVFYQGDKVGTVRRFSDTLLIFLLKGAKPEKYRDRTDVRHSGAVAVAAGIKLEALSREDLDTLEQILDKAGQAAIEGAVSVEHEDAPE